MGPNLTLLWNCYESIVLLCIVLFVIWQSTGREPNIPNLSLTYFLFSNALILIYFLYYVWGWTVAHMFGLSTRLKCYCDSPKKMLLQMPGTFSFKAIQNNCDYVAEGLAGFC